MTRDQRFRDSFDEFFLAEIKSENLKHYDPLRLLTKNTKKNLHEYVLTIPSRYKIYDVTNDVFDEDGNLIHPRESVFTNQVLPDFEFFETKYFGYFDKYRLFDGCRTLSWTYVYNMNTTQDNFEVDNPSFTVVIDVYYYKNYSPYPIKPEMSITNDKYNKLLKQNNDLMEKNENLTEQIEGLHDLVIMNEQKNRFLQKKINRLYDMFSKNHNRMTNKIIELLNEENKYEDCPVCYEKMDSDTIIVPGCCHYICCDCMKKCENCPICREKYCMKCK
jgi:hypothetical protein